MISEKEAKEILLRNQASRFSNLLLKHSQTCKECQFNWYQIFLHLFTEENDFLKDFNKLAKKMRSS